MKEEKGFSRIFLGFVKTSGFLPGLLFFKPKVFYVNKEKQSKNLPRPCIFMSNHKSLMDFALYLIAFPFVSIRFLMAEVLYNKGKIFAKFLYLLGGIKVDRDAYNFDFVDKSVDFLNQGQVVGIFPEGRLPIGGKMSPFKPSTVVIALRSGVPIIPVYTDGSYGITKRAKIVIGEPINITDYLTDKTIPADQVSKEEINRLNDILKDEIIKLQKFLEDKNGKK